MKETAGKAWGKRPLIISGPCSAETEEQVLQTAQRLAATGKVDMLRAGIWKPRTKPGMFEGIGAKGLPWLLQAKKLTGLPTTVEVATGKQVHDALTFDVDVLWIGARTTVNPFSVQEVADALRGVDVPVLIKNPINPDLELWSGAVERVARSGIKNIGLIHRGFSSYGNTEYRNAPMWHLAIEMKRRNPELLIINDPSHICGRRDILMDVAQKAIDLDFDGLMIESHIDPDNAWSDAKQQVTPEKLANWSGRTKRYAADVGDGSNTSITVTHNLNTRDVQVAVRRNSGAYEEVLVDWGATTVNTITLTFASAPSAGQFRVIVIA